MRLFPTVSPRRPGATILAAAMATLMSACADAGDDPFGSVLAEETGGALELQTSLPSPTGWVEEFEIEDMAGMGEWERSWELDTSLGRGSREAAYRAMVPILLTHMEGEDLQQGLESLEVALNEAEEIPTEDIPDRVTERLDLARDAQLRGSLALTNGDPTRALTELIRGTDSLREVEPGQVAAQLLAAADGGMRRLLGTESYSEQTRERAQSLIRIARTAVRDGDLTRAIQSAYYATQLLEVEVR